jgi:hypothetical protein
MTPTGGYVLEVRFPTNQKFTGWVGFQDDDGVVTDITQARVMPTLPDAQREAEFVTSTWFMTQATPVPRSTSARLRPEPLTKEEEDICI